MGLQCNLTLSGLEIIYQPDGYFTKSKVYAQIVDDSGNPANGNNAIIEYSVNENGAITTEHKTIAGQSMLLYYGVVEKATDDGFGNVTVYYTKTFGFATVLGSPDPSPPVNFCDLYIDAITVNKKESAPGAADGQITVTASSSYLPLHYSLDNTTFQTSNIFTGLTGGLKTVYVTDSNTAGCSANRVVTIPVLNSLLVSDPSVTVGGNISRWNAAFNPIVFTYQRKDFEVTSVEVDSATGKAKVFANTNLTGIVAKDFVYINTAIYKGVFSVISNTGNALIIDTPYNG
jgi:hypothetical protein